MKNKEGGTVELGLIINPIAGLGGPMALKGSDIGSIRALAAQNNVSPRARMRTAQALELLLPYKEQLFFHTASGEMGEMLLKELNFDYDVAYQAPVATTAEDTLKAAKAIAKLKPLLILFTGGDGTARNMADVLGTDLPALGIPAGVKMHSAVFASTPRDAGRLLERLISRSSLSSQHREVMDIDEGELRKGRVISRLYGYMSVPYEKSLLQNRKAGRLQSEVSALRGIARRVIGEMQPDVIYLMCGGSTVKAVMDEMSISGTLLGVDIVQNGRLIKADATAADIEKAVVGKPFRAVLTVIGSQGYIIGRGNQQLSQKVLKSMTQQDIILIATKEKLLSILGEPMRIDTGDPELDASMAGHYKVTVGYDEYVVYPAK